MEMDSETALRLVKQGATLLLLGVPQFTLFGIDTQIFSVGPAFKGIKMIPPGPHFVYYSSSNREGNEFSPVVGFFIYPSASEVLVWKWLQEEERLIKLSEEEEGRYSEAVKKLEFDHQLGPYAYNHYGEWKHLSNYITEKVIKQFQPIGGEITITCESGIINGVPKTEMEKRLMKQLKSSKFSRLAENSQGGCYYTSIPHVVKHRGISGEELTSLNIDKTQLLEAILSKDYDGSEDLLLGEFQFAFIAFLMGQSLEAFLQWKAILSLLFSCIDAPFHTRSLLFIKFIRAVYYQLKHGFHREHKNDYLEKGASVVLDDFWLSKDVFLHRLLKDFFSLVEEASVVDGDLLSWTRRLRDLVETTLGWDFKNDVIGSGDEGNDEFSPVIEMLDSTGPSEMSG